MTRSGVNLTLNRICLKHHGEGVGKSHAGSIANVFVSNKPFSATCRSSCRRRRRRHRPDASRDHDRTARDPRPDGRAGHARADVGRSADGSVAREVAEAQALLETYRAQIEQCEKLKVELDLIHDAINRTKREIAVLHGKSFDGERNGQGQWRTRRRGRRHRRSHPADSRSRRSDRSGRDRAGQGHFAGPAEAAQRGNPGTRHLDLRSLQFPGSHRPAHQQGDDAR